MEIQRTLNLINQYLLNPIIALLFAIALVVFIVGIVQFIASETSDAKRDDGKKKIIWGLFGMFVMVSAFGLIRLILSTFGIDPGYPFEWSNTNLVF